GDIFKLKTSDTETKDVTFSDLFDETTTPTTTKLQQMMAYWGVEADGESENDEGGNE
ncbi:MAG: hypothetical protein HUJ98_11290, partial [Bacteroidaceae bacterium]|nr:hypothetical protein [Bacteroidaceae bacterium]